MAEPTDSADDRETADAQIKNYLPGMTRVSSEPGRVERFVTNLFRRRGEFGTVRRRRQ